MKNLLILGQLIACMFCVNMLSSCSDDKEDVYKRDQPVVVESNPEANAVIHPAATKFNIVFNKAIVVNDLTKISINGVQVKSAVATDKTLKIVGDDLKENTQYALTIVKGAIAGAVGTSNQEDIIIPFSTQAGEELTLVSMTPEEGAVINPARTTINLFFNQNIKVVDTLAITVNGKSATTVLAAGPRLSVSAGFLDKQTSFNVSIPAGAISTTYEHLNTGAFSLTFSTADNPLPVNLVVKNPSQQAKNVYAFLRDNFGKKIISGTMANVNLNINEAEWVFKHTGKYPALNGFDYVHLNEAWIDYNNLQVVENWWNKNGLVSYSWHWMVKNNAGTGMTYKPGEGDDETTFDISKINDPASHEYAQVRTDLDAVANNLLLLKQKNIPVIWRPLHEAAGAWFWWGAKAPEDLKALWILMFEVFEAKGLNNLIWVWTAEPGDDAWYPGDQYVDIVGRDLYKKSSIVEISGEYENISNRYPGKIVTLSECGSVLNISEQADAGIYWSWFMPWYDYYRTKNMSGTAFDEPGHEHASINYWKNAFSCKDVISRDMMPSLK